MNMLSFGSITPEATDVSAHRLDMKVQINIRFSQGLESGRHGFGLQWPGIPLI